MPTGKLSPVDQDGETREILMQLVGAGRELLRRFNQVLATTGMRARQVAALRELEAGPRPQQALAEALAMDPTKLVGLLNELETEGLIERTRDPEDRRRHTVALTAPGRQRLTDAMRMIDDFEEGALAGLDAAERRALLEALRTIRGQLQHDPEERRVP